MEEILGMKAMQVALYYMVTKIWLRAWAMSGGRLL